MSANFRRPRFKKGAGARERSLLLQVVQALLGSLQALEVFHHLLHVVLGVAVLDVGEPAAAHADDDGHHQHEVLQVVVSVHWDGEDIREIDALDCSAKSMFVR